MSLSEDRLRTISFLSILSEKELSMFFGSNSEIELCHQHLKRALVSIKASDKLSGMINNTIIVPESIDSHSFIKQYSLKILIPHGKRMLGVSLSIPPDTMGNRLMDGVGQRKHPSIIEISLMYSTDDFSDLYNELGYDSLDYRRFRWNANPQSPDCGFAKVINEIARLRAVLDALVTDTPDLTSPI